MFRELGVVLLLGGFFSCRQPGRQHPLEGLLLDAHMFQLPGEEVLLVQDAGDAAVILAGCGGSGSKLHRLLRVRPKRQPATG